MSNQKSRINMITQQLRTNGVLDEKILDLYTQLPRHEFVPKQLAHFAYSDMQIPLDHHQKMLTPLEEGTILQALSLQGHETVLEIGTGTGFFTALLSRLVSQVISVDYYEQFSLKAAQKLEAFECSNVKLITGDASRGWLEAAPYDVIVFTGALETITETHKLQIIPGGTLFTIVGQSPIMQARMYQLDHNGLWQESMLFETDVPQLVNQIKPTEFIF